MSKASKQAYKDMGSLVKRQTPFADPFYDVWDVTRSRVFTKEARDLNKLLTD